jgi:signal transduction histidine kinase
MLQNAKGEKIEHECSLGIVSQDASGSEEQMVAIAVNMSRQKALQASLIEAREAAESADRIKSMFVASMSHELRTPLNSIIGFLGVVLQGMSGELNVKQKDQLGRAYHSAKHLLSLISDVIDISKIEAGFLNVHVEKFELKQLLNEVEHAAEHLANEKQLDLYIDCPAKLMLETDRKRLYQVVLNVVGNALKYTEKGSVKVAASIKNKQLFIIVEDTGIGINEAGLANLFKPFERIDSRLRIKTLGTGLGLYLTRKILSQLLGGTIEAKSKPEQGSTFTIALPTKMPELIVQNASILEEPNSAESRLKELQL